MVTISVHILTFTTVLASIFVKPINVKHVSREKLENTNCWQIKSSGVQRSRCGYVISELIEG